MRFVLLTTLLMLCFPTFAQKMISLKLANSLALEHHYELAKYPFQIRQQYAMSLQSRIKPSPKLRLEVDDLIGTNQYDLLDLSEISLVFSQTVEMGNKQSLRVSHSEAIEDSLYLEFELAKLDVQAETSRRYYQLLKLQSLQQVLLEKIELEKITLAKIKDLIQVGAVGSVDKAVILLRLAHSKSALLQLKSKQEIAKNRLRAMWQDRVSFDKVQGSILNLPKLPIKKQLEEALDGSPAILYLLSLQREADTNLSLLKASSKADVVLSGGVTHKATDDSQTLSVGISIPLYFSNPNKGRIEKATVALEQSKTLSHQSRKKIERVLSEHWLKMYQYKQQVEQLNGDILPAVENLLKLATEDYKRGNGSIIQIVDAQKQWFDSKINLIEKMNLIYMELLELERLTVTKLGK
jgi:cobalt-zinc-cadmium efflux system outer membrane protein